MWLRTMVPLALALSALAAFGCGRACGDVNPTGIGSAYLMVDLLPDLR
jgi:hypothetical protein